MGYMGNITALELVKSQHWDAADPVVKGGGAVWDATLWVYPRGVWNGTPTMAI